MSSQKGKVTAFKQSQRTLSHSGGKHIAPLSFVQQILHPRAFPQQIVCLSWTELLHSPAQKSLPYQSPGPLPPWWVLPKWVSFPTVSPEDSVPSHPITLHSPLSSLRLQQRNGWEGTDAGARCWWESRSEGGPAESHESHFQLYIKWKFLWAALKAPTMTNATTRALGTNGC